MAIIDDIISKAQAAGKFVCEKTEDTVDYVSLEYKASTLRTKLTEQYAKLGKLTFEAAGTGADNSQESAAVIEDIKGLMAELEENNVKMSKFKKVCKSCQSKNSPKASYCSNCGKEL